MALVVCPIPRRMAASQAGSAAGFLRYAAKPHRYAVSAEPGAQVRALAGRRFISSKDNKLRDFQAPPSLLATLTLTVRGCYLRGQYAIGGPGQLPRQATFEGAQDAPIRIVSASSGHRRCRLSEA